MFCLSSCFKLHALEVGLLTANTFSNSHVASVAAFVINNNTVVLLPVKIFLEVICWINNSDYLCFLTYFPSPTALSYEPAVADSGQTEYETAPKLKFFVDQADKPK